MKRSDYEELLAEYSNYQSALNLLRQHRPYLAMVPSMRRSSESIITLPLPVVKLRNAPIITPGKYNYSPVQTTSKVVDLPCEITYLMCDPEWKIKMGNEIFIFIHHPDEDLSDLLGRWRQTQVLLNHDYEWLMPACYDHIISEGSDKIYPLFVLAEDSPARIKKGLTGANLPFVIVGDNHLITEDLLTPTEEVME
jgi:hypothetical protein